VAAYVNQVLIAYGDVEDALTDLHALTSETESLQQAVAASENYRRLAQVQYTNGLVDYLTVIDAEADAAGESTGAVAGDQARR